MSNKNDTKFFDIGGGKGMYIPGAIRSDSAYPFKDESNLQIEISGKSLVISEKTDE